VNDRHLLFRPGEWAGLPLTGWWAVTDGTEFIALVKDQADATAFALMKGAENCVSQAAEQSCSTGGGEGPPRDRPGGSSPPTGSAV
jgi:hypothetical protein